MAIGRKNAYTVWVIAVTLALTLVISFVGNTRFANAQINPQDIFCIIDGIFEGTGSPLHPIFFPDTDQCPAGETPTECSDGIDNADPEDTLIDLEDPGCSSLSDDDETDPVTPAPQCSNGIDDDGDGFADGDDPNCHTDGDPSNSSSYNPNGGESGTLPVCFNGVDDDEDGFTDWSPLAGGDPGCATPLDGDESNSPPPPPPNPENTLPLCSDSIDNDEDDLVDLADPNCSSFMPTLTVIKVVINDNNGTSTVGDFPLFVGTTSVVSSTTTTLNPGIYAVSETSNNGYTASFSGDCNSSGSVTLAAGDAKICTITNDDVSGLPSLQCTDGLDNDGDGLVDNSDPGCVDSEDNDEFNNPPNPGGGPGGGPPSESPIVPTGGGNGPPGLVTFGGGGGGIVLGASTGPALGVSAEQCNAYLSGFIRYGGQNDSEQVLRLQRFLRDIEGASAVSETGVYDEASLAAVHAFQNKYSDRILAPWGATRSTGFVYHTTRKAVNEVYCKFTADFPLTADQLTEIGRIKSLGESFRPSSSVAPGTLPIPSSPIIPPQGQDSDVGSAKVENLPASVGETAPVVESLWSRIRSRIFGR